MTEVSDIIVKEFIFLPFRRYYSFAKRGKNVVDVRQMFFFVARKDDHVVDVNKARLPRKSSQGDLQPSLE